MPKKMPATIVKELRGLTENWDETGSPGMLRVRVLIDQLPSFRAAPQTRVENTLRAIEAVLRANLNIDPTLKPVTENTGVTLGAYEDLPMVTLLSVARIINTHHKVGQAKLTPGKQVMWQQPEEGPSHQDGPQPSIPDGCNGFYNTTFSLVHLKNCPVHGVVTETV